MAGPRHQGSPSRLPHDPSPCARLRLRASPGPSRPAGARQDARYREKNSRQGRNSAICASTRITISEIRFMTHVTSRNAAHRAPVALAPSYGMSPHGPGPGPAAPVTLVIPSPARGRPGRQDARPCGHGSHATAHVESPGCARWRGQGRGHFAGDLGSPGGRGLSGWRSGRSRRPWRLLRGNAW